MDTNVEYFEKFVVKQIVSTVNYNPETDDYEINRIHISNDIIRIIEAEGARYGLQKQQVAQLISRIASNIKVEPSTQMMYNSVNAEKFKQGDHIRINFKHPQKGNHYLEMIATECLKFYVIRTDIGGICYGDELEAIDKTWNITFYIDFILLRQSIRLPHPKAILRIGKVECIEVYHPSIINDILDAKSTYTFDSLKLQKDDAKNETKEKLYYFWMPNRWTPISFCWKEGMEQSDVSTFIIKDKEDSEEASITLNPQFNILQIEENLDSFMEMIFDCCKWKNSFNGLENLKSIKPVKPGVVKRRKSELYLKEWELITPPKIKFVYNE